MAQLEKHDWEGGTNGAAITQAGESLHLVQGTWVYSNAKDPSGGTLSAHFTTTGSAQINGLSAWAAQATPFARIDINMVSLPSATTPLTQYRSGSTVRAELRVTTAGALQMRNSSFTQIAISPNGLISTNTKIRINWSYNNTTGKQQVQVFTGANFAGTTPDYDSGLVTTTAAGTVDGWNMGAITSATWEYYLGDIQWDGAAFPAGPAGTNTPPTANAGPDQTGIEPSTTVTLDFSGSSDPDGTIASYNVTQTAGTTVTLNHTDPVHPTYTAPLTLAGETETFSLTVTDNSAATSSADTVNVTVLPAPAAIMRAGVWVPANVTLI